MTSPLPPNMRRVDIDAEAARLAGERKAASRQWFIVFGEICDAPDGEQMLVQVSATKPLTFVPGLGGKLAAVVRENWPACDE